MTTDITIYKPLVSDIGCIIMASGEGSRFGGNKLMADFGGRPLISYIINTAKSIFENIVVVTRHKDVAQFCRDLNVPVIYHSLPYRSDTIRLGLEHFGSNLSGYIFCQGDQPLLSEKTLLDMISEFSQNKENIIRLQYDSTPCSPVVFPTWCYENLLNLPQGKGGNVIVKKHLDKVVYVSAHNRFETIDVDTKEDLLALIEYI